MEPLTHAFNLNVYRATGTRPFDLDMSHPPPEVTLHYDDDEPSTIEKGGIISANQLETDFAKVPTYLNKALRLYKSNFDKRLHKAHH